MTKIIDLIKHFQSSITLKEFPKMHAFAIAVLGSTLLLFSSITIPSNEAKEAQRSEKVVALAIAKSSDVIMSSKAAVLPPSNIENNDLSETLIIPKQEPLLLDLQNHTETVKSGDNLSILFQRAGLSDTSLFELMQSNTETKQLTRLHPGQKIHFEIDDKKLYKLTYQKNKLNKVTFSRSDAGFDYEKILLEPDVQVAFREATIENSLFLAGTNAGMEQSLIMEVAGIFGWDIDFALDIRSNDHFSVLYEEHFLEGEKLGNGPILAAEFTNQGKTFKAVRYTDSSGSSNYFTPEGNSMRKAFLRTPVDFARISSHFNLQRKHPVLNRIRAHKGTDYAAPTGTPIKAAGDGRVTWAGTKGGYGRTVMLQHGQSYKTLYAHMSRYGKGIKNGTRVKQGQIIGYVGSSGLATGPHLHYEFYLNGAVRNPVSVNLPKAKAIPKTELANFTLQTQSIVATLQNYQKNIQVASSSQ
jgi:murein DD-endopeptidase MepM/ murein hydrolase activator NlpD